MVSKFADLSKTGVGAMVLCKSRNVKRVKGKFNMSIDDVMELAEEITSRENLLLCFTLWLSVLMLILSKGIS